RRRPVAHPARPASRALSVVFERPSRLADRSRAPALRARRARRSAARRELARTRARRRASRDEPRVARDAARHGRRSRATLGSDEHGARRAGTRDRARDVRARGEVATRRELARARCSAYAHAHFGGAESVHIRGGTLMLRSTTIRIAVALLALLPLAARAW